MYEVHVCVLIVATLAGCDSSKGEHLEKSSVAI